MIAFVVVKVSMSLKAHNLGVAFGGTWVFRGVSLTIEPGQRIALVGPSGSGKSLLLKSLALLHPFDEGRVDWFGEKVGGNRVPAFRSEVMYVPQRAPEVDGLVEEFLKVPFSFAANAAKSYDRELTLSNLKTLGRNDDFLAKPQRELSGGERQIAALIRAVLLNPKVLLLDEPTSAMDGDTASQAEQLITDWCAEDSSRSTVWVTHDIDQAARVSRTQFQMNDLSTGASQ